MALRFIKILRKQHKGPSPLTAQELKGAKLLWESRVQDGYFPDVIKAIKNGQRNNLKDQLGLQLDGSELLRCHGRLVNADLVEGARLPKLLPKKEHFTDLVIKDYHKNLLHAGTSQTLVQNRQEY